MDTSLRRLEWAWSRGYADPLPGIGLPPDERYYYDRFYYDDDQSGSYGGMYQGTYDPASRVAFPRRRGDRGVGSGSAAARLLERRDRRLARGGDDYNQPPYPGMRPRTRDMANAPRQMPRDWYNN